MWVKKKIEKEILNWDWKRNCLKIPQKKENMNEKSHEKWKIEESQQKKKKLKEKIPIKEKIKGKNTYMGSKKAL